ncbi:hypothetical protein FBEOM_14679 [Fusarium beomiforme]|uniref:Uncharacterized protein n=1 Tax=Fusarium beomiforme TaxID=44412 RepID=A0A9P5A4U4_9HYPO|nr:hypothetical protein FBEOM_14679 [Fusarium beomiforme]
MGIASSVISAVPAAARFLIGNSGAIGDVVKAVRDVTGLEAFEDEDEFSIVPNPDLFTPKVSIVSLEKDLRKANDRLDAEAKKGLEPPRQDDDRVTKSTKVNNLFWTVPSHPVGSHYGIPSAEMYRDLALILREKGFPLFWKERNGDAVDVAYRLAQGLFANAKEKGIAILIKDDSYIHKLPVSIESGDQGGIINAQHVCYKIPMGKTGTEDAWQAALHMNKSLTDDFRHEYELEEADLIFLSNRKPPTGPVWILTCEINWRTVLKAKNAGKSLGPKLEEDLGYYVPFTNTEANLQIIKIVTRANVAPAQVRANIEVLAGKLSNNVGNSNLRLLDKVTEPLSAQGPDVNIANAAYNGDYKATGDYQMAIRRQAAEEARREARNQREIDDMTARILAGKDDMAIRRKP